MPKTRRRALANKIPIIPKVSIQKVLEQAEHDTTLLTIESDDPGVAYITDLNEFVVITEDSGVMRMPIDRMMKIFNEAIETMQVMR